MVIIFRRIRIKRKAKLAIKLLQNYFKDIDDEVYDFLCNKVHIQIFKKECVDNGITDEFSLGGLTKDGKVYIDIIDGFVHKVYSNNISEMKLVYNINNVVDIQNDTRCCTWDEIISYFQNVLKND